MLLHNPNTLPMAMALLFLAASAAVVNASDNPVLLPSGQPPKLLTSPLDSVQVDSDMCDNLEALQDFLTTQLEEMIAGRIISSNDDNKNSFLGFTAPFDCVCDASKNQDVGKSLEATCRAAYRISVATHNATLAKQEEDEDYYYEVQHWERALYRSAVEAVTDTLHKISTTLNLVETSWGEAWYKQAFNNNNSSIDDRPDANPEHIFRETYQWGNSMQLSGCKAHGCAQCTICVDGTTVQKMGCRKEDDGCDPLMIIVTEHNSDCDGNDTGGMFHLYKNLDHNVVLSTLSLSSSSSSVMAAVPSTKFVAMTVAAFMATIVVVM